MKIEDEIKTKDFANNNHKAQLNIMFTAGWIRSAAAASLKQFALTPEQYNVLRILRSSPEALCLKDITCRMVDRNSNTSRIVDKLTLRGIVKRDLSLADRREVQISLTDKGLELVNEIYLQHKSLVQSTPSGLSEEEAELLSNLLDKMRLS